MRIHHTGSQSSPDEERTNFRRTRRTAGKPLGLEVDGDIRSTHDTQEEAINEGRGLAEQEQGELVIHGEDGKIREKDSHGNDPRNIPG